MVWVAMLGGLCVRFVVAFCNVLVGCEGWSESQVLGLCWDSRMSRMTSLS